ncbi:hypothetical protein A8C32_02520 [Flavivirga aquatica]|uniref:Uncharacterized protein n=2 Tax=Flavivirga aquatica TaxID=1849968 RepID=A0A1E5TAC5_9FLAO|nr:hypothetical protein A8C32_02520 [Flavivirga aquatica]
MGYASNYNSNCFDDEIFRMKNNERFLSQKIIDSVNQSKYKELIKETDIYTYQYVYDGVHINDKIIKIRKLIRYYEEGGDKIYEVFLC